MENDSQFNQNNPPSSNNDKGQELKGNKDGTKGSPPASDIPNGGGDAEKQPKEHTGKDTEMGGSTGGESKNDKKDPHQ